MKIFTIICFIIAKTYNSIKIHNYHSNNIYYTYISTRKARPVLLKIQNNSCFMCNKQFSHYVPHEIHHIDHNSKNNIFKNFVALCSNCHAGHHRYGLYFPIEKHNKFMFSYFVYSHLYNHIYNVTKL